MEDEELLQSNNPVDPVLFAAKYSALSRNEHQKYRYLRKATELLTKQGLKMEEQRNLLLFIERILYLEDKELSAQYKEYLQELSEEGKIMVYIPFYEREDAEKVRQEGLQQGLWTGKEEMAKNLLANGVSPDIIAKSAGLPLERIQSLMN